MQRRRFKQVESLEDRLAQEAKRLREEAKSLSPGITRDELIRKARQCETGSHMSDCLRSPGLKPPDSGWTHLNLAKSTGRAHTGRQEGDVLLYCARHTQDLGMAAQGRTLPAAKKAPGPLIGTLESRDSKNDGLSVG